jgi:hypothetical protein
VKTAEQGWSWASGHPTAAALGAMAVLIAVFLVLRGVRKSVSAARGALKGQAGEDLLTIVAAALAQAVVMNGMWGFAGHVLHFTGAERGSLFAFLEIAVVACAFRARRNMREFRAAGVEGTAVWVLSALSGTFAALAATSLAAALFRLCAPLVAAWLWHRAMALEHRRSTGRSVHWRMSTERILVWLRLADPVARDTTEVAAHARLAQLARSAKKLRVLRQGGARAWRQGWALRRLESALGAAVEHAGLATDPERQDLLRDLIGSLTAAGSLAELTVPPPWDRTAAPARTTAEIFSDIARTITPVAETPDPGPLEPMHEAGGTEPGPWLPPADPDPGPDAPVPPGSGLRVPAAVDELLARWDEPPPPDDLDAEAREVFGQVPSPAPVHHEDAPRAAPARKPASTRAPARKPASSTVKEWTPETVGKTEDEVIAMVRSLTRNKLAEALPCSRGTADKLREKYLQPATAGASGSR